VNRGRLSAERSIIKEVSDTIMATQASPDARSGGDVSVKNEELGIDEIPETMLAVQVVEVST
jgi:hypothetical protein